MENAKQANTAGTVFAAAVNPAKAATRTAEDVIIITQDAETVFVNPARTAETARKTADTATIPIPYNAATAIATALKAAKAATRTAENAITETGTHAPETMTAGAGTASTGYAEAIQITAETMSAMKARIAIPVQETAEAARNLE